MYNPIQAEQYPQGTYASLSSAKGWLAKQYEKFKTLITSKTIQQPVHRGPTYARLPPNLVSRGHQPVFHHKQKQFKKIQEQPVHRGPTYARLSSINNSKRKSILNQDKRATTEKQLEDDQALAKKLQQEEFDKLQRRQYEHPKIQRKLKHRGPTYASIPFNNEKLQTEYQIISDEALARQLKKEQLNDLHHLTFRKLRKRKYPKSSAKKSPKRSSKKSPKRKSPKRKSPKRKSPKRKSPKRKSPKRKSPKRKSPKRNTCKR
jgi:hypothetical protein